MTTQTTLSRSWSLVATAIALGLGIVVGHVVNVPLPARDRGARVLDEAGSQPSSKRYKIPVSISQPALGRADALVTIVEWCDVPDAECSAIEPALQALVEGNQDELRLVFRHYGRPDRPGSMAAHQFLRVAHEHGGKFWQARARLLEHRGEPTLADLERYAGQLGLDWKTVKEALDKHTFAGVITADRVFADMFEVQTVPAIFVNGRPLGGEVTKSALERLVRDELARAKALIGNGVAKADVYAELTKNGAWNKPKLTAAP